MVTGPVVEEYPKLDKRDREFANYGAEAGENAVKIARNATQKSAVVAFENGFHGRTLMGMSLASLV